MEGESILSCSDCLHCMFSSSHLKHVSNPVRAEISRSSKTSIDFEHCAAEFDGRFLTWDLHIQQCHDMLSCPADEYLGVTSGH